MTRWIFVLLALALALSTTAAIAQDTDDDEADTDGDAGPPAKLKEAKTADKQDARDALPAEVTISFSTTPPTAARVMWGKRELCVTPCSITRKRDSGPLDVVFRAGGFLPLYTRAFTFKDDKVIARMVAVGNESAVLGYKEPVDGGVEEAPPGE